MFWFSTWGVLIIAVVGIGIYTLFHKIRLQVNRFSRTQDIQNRYGSTPSMFVMINSSGTNRSCSVAKLINHLCKQAASPMSLTVAVCECSMDLQDTKYWYSSIYTSSVDHSSQIVSYVTDEVLSPTRAYSELLRHHYRGETYTCIVSDRITSIQAGWDRTLVGLLLTEATPKTTSIGSFAIGTPPKMEQDKGRPRTLSVPERLLFPRLHNMSWVLESTKQPTQQTLPVVIPSPDLCLVVGTGKGVKDYRVSPVNLCTGTSLVRYTKPRLKPSDAAIMGLVTDCPLEKEIKYGDRYNSLLRRRRKLSVQEVKKKQR